jgi:exopolysaccharide biosynthesis protein
MLLRDSALVDGLDSLGGRNFAPVRHPRTAVGIAAGGRRLLLVVVDGRQPGYSDGMTLTELATMMRALGARDAINLDGGGSSSIVRTDRASVNGVRILNKPSDKEGERPVGNALLLACGPRP